jgi:hypothetical protein
VTISSFDLRGKVAGPKAVSDTQVIGFEVMATSEVSIVEVIDATGVETPMVEGVNYSITLSGTVPSDGTIKFLTALAAGSTWYWVRNTTLDQQSPYVALDKFPSTTHERALDKLTLALQDLQDLAKRSLRAPTQDEAQDLVLGPKADRLDKFIKFDAVTGLPTLVNEVALSTVAFTAIGILVAEAANAATIRGASILDVLEDVLTTRGDLLVRGAAAEDRLGIGANGTVLTSDGTDPGWSTPTAQTLPRSYLAGLGLSNGTDFDHDIDIAVGECRDGADTQDLVLAAAVGKQIDVAWAAGGTPGVPAGGLFAGAAAIAVDLWYHVFLIRKDSDGSIDAGFDDNLSCTNIPPGYTAFRRIGSVQMKSATPDLKQFIQDGDYVQWTDPVMEVNLASTGTTATLSAQLSTPLGLRNRVLLNVASFSGPGGAAYIYDPQLTALAPSMTVAPLSSHQVDPTGTRDAEQVWCRTDTASKVKLDWDANFDNFRMATIAYIDRRGRDD